ncbi:MAG TPA: hypothetical protein VFS40_09465 [Gemmatimonadales bacterium]|nr:hypothetical protein [Gemmatimonadales bacterium]
MRSALLVALLAGLAPPRPAECPRRVCTCAGWATASEAAQAADLVFVARAVSVRDTSVTDSRGSGRAPATFRFTVATLAVEYGWKGLPPDTLDLLGTGSGGDCLMGFERGRRYLLYVQASAGQLSTTWCSRSARADAAVRDLAALGPPEYRR